MNVLMISDVYFPRVNGVSTSIQTYRRDLMELGHRCLLAAPEYPGAGVADDAELLRIPSRGVPRDPEDRMLSRRRLLEQTGRIAGEGIDVVHVQTPFVAHYAGIELARRLGVPVVESYHTYFEHYLHHYVPALPRSLLQYLARRFTVSQCHQVDAVISPSGQMAEALRAYGVRTPLEVLPTGLPPGRFAAGNGSRFRLRRGIPAQRPLALFVGRVAHEKNIDFLVRMLPRLRALVPDVLLVIAGEGPALEHCRQLVAQLDLASSVQFVGYMDRDTELLDCYRAADVFVFASRTETQGLVLLEAMAQGTPVVSTAVMGTVDVLPAPRVVPWSCRRTRPSRAPWPGVLHDPARRAVLAARATEDAQRWSSRSLAERLLHVYESVIAARAVTKASSSRRTTDMVPGQSRVA